MSVDFGILAAFALLWIVIVPSPGANVLLITQLALTRPAREVAIALAGNLLGVALWSMAALLGLTVLLATVPAARLAIYLLGGAYLIWFGLRLLRASGVAPSAAPGRAGAPFVIGLVTALSNAQAVFFITSIFAVAGVINANAATAAAVVTVLVCCNGLYLGFLSWLLLKPTPRRAYQRWRATMQRMFGTLFMVFGGGLVWKALRG